MNSPDIIEAKDFKLAERAQLYCVLAPPVCPAAEEYFVDSIVSGRRLPVKREAVVDIMIRKEGVIHMTSVRVNRMIMKTVGQLGGAITDEGLLHGFLVAPNRYIEERYILGRPLRPYKYNGITLAQRLKLKRNDIDPHQIAWGRLHPDDNTSPEWIGNLKKLVDGELPAL